MRKLPWFLVALMFSLLAQPAAAQSDDWKISIYPAFVWVPLGIDIDVDLPPFEGGGAGGGGKIAEGRFDGAFFGGLSAEKGKFRFDFDGLWAGFGGDRPESPILRVDVDAIYGHASAGIAVRPGLFVTGGVRRVALKYEIELNGNEFERKPGIWDPLVGLSWHSSADNKVVWHAIFETGGFGVGSDVEVSTGLRLDWKPISHFGITAGYNLLYIKLTNEVLAKTFTVTQTLHGPVVGIGFYF
jgi:hypothetical protein